jgi:RHS repeat-associated protein
MDYQMNSFICFSYNPYGTSTSKVTDELLGYNGQYRDPAYALYFLGNGERAFHPGIFRFLSPDNWSPFALGGINSYCYCSNDPINQHDPSGHAPLRHVRERYRSPPPYRYAKISSNLQARPDVQPLAQSHNISATPRAPVSIWLDLIGPPPTYRDYLLGFSLESSSTSSPPNYFQYVKPRLRKNIPPPRYTFFDPEKPLDYSKLFDQNLIQLTPNSNLNYPPLGQLHKNMKDVRASQRNDVL